MTNSQILAAKQGEAAHGNCADSASNPYQLGTEERAYWIEGYFGAQHAEYVAG